MPVEILVVGENSFDFHRLAEKAPLFEAIFADTDCSLTMTDDRTALAADRLADYDVVVDYLTDPPAEYVEDIVAFVRDGGGFVGLHSAADVSTFVEEPVDALASLVGGRFVGHPETATFGVRIRDADHPCVEGIEDFEVYDEPYDVALEDDADVHLLADMDHPELDGTPVAWTRTEGDGRVVYCSLGHTDEAFETEAFRRLLVQGVRWAVEQGQTKG
jgi:type 1 glutamine amidotransferase